MNVATMPKVDFAAVKQRQHLVRVGAPDADVSQCSGTTLLNNLDSGNFAERVAGLLNLLILYLLAIDHRDGGADATNRLSNPRRSDRDIGKLRR